MPIDLQNDELLSLSDAAKVLPLLDGRRLHTATLWRWCSRGVRGVRLDHGRLGHRIVTSLDALNKFVNALAELDKQPPQPRPVCHANDTRPRARTTKQREADIRRAEARLKKAGVL